MKMELSPLSKLQKEHQRLDASISNLQQAYNTLGKSEGVKRWDFTLVTGFERADRTLAVGVFKERIAKRIDELTLRLEEIPVFLQLQGIDEILRLVQYGHLSEEDLTRTRQDLVFGEKVIPSGIEPGFKEPAPAESILPGNKDKIVGRDRSGEGASEQVELEVKSPQLPYKIQLGAAIFENGKVIRGRRAQMLDILQTHFRENPISAKELVVELLGEDTKLTRMNVSFIMSVLRRTLNGFSSGLSVVTQSDPKMRFKRQEAKYYLEFQPARGASGEVKAKKLTWVKTEDIDEDVAPILAAVITVEDRGIADEETAEGLEQFAEVVEYEPPAEFIRTVFETDVLRVITNGLSESARLWFDRMQGALMAGNRERLEERTEIIHPGISKVYVYSSNELYQAFKEGYKKLKREQEIPALRERLEKNEKDLWTKISALKKKLKTSEDPKFLRQIKAEIEKADRDYYNTRRREGGGRPFIIYDTTGR